MPTAAGVRFSAVAEVHVSASAIEDDSLVCSTDPGKVPETSSVPVGDTPITKPMKHSAQKIDLDGIPGQ